MNDDGRTLIGSRLLREWQNFQKFILVQIQVVRLVRMVQFLPELFQGDENRLSGIILMGHCLGCFMDDNAWAKGFEDLENNAGRVVGVKREKRSTNFQDGKYEDNEFLSWGKTETNQKVIIRILDWDRRS